MTPRELIEQVMERCRAELRKHYRDAAYVLDNFDLTDIYAEVEGMVLVPIETPKKGVEEDVVKETPQQMRDRGVKHCPECYTFGHQHRKNCSIAAKDKEGK